MILLLVALLQLASSHQQPNWYGMCAFLQENLSDDEEEYAVSWCIEQEGKHVFDVAIVCFIRLPLPAAELFRVAGAGGG
jgi:hypothetical protein